MTEVIIERDPTTDAYFVNGQRITYGDFRVEMDRHPILPPSLRMQRAWEVLVERAVGE